ncbi:HTH domain-containing protein [bacterium]|nr:HTH domain-containing protein [bacterium]
MIATTISEISEILKITERAVEKQIKALRQSGRLKRVGARKGGHWEVSG